jgi:hypothetical protein
VRPIGALIEKVMADCQSHCPVRGRRDIVRTNPSIRETEITERQATATMKVVAGTT